MEAIFSTSYSRVLLFKKSTDFVSKNQSNNYKIIELKILKTLFKYIIGYTENIKNKGTRKKLRTKKKKKLKFNLPA